MNHTDPNPIKKVEHINVVSSQPQALFDFLQDVLLLPEVWPFSDYGNFASGGLSLGNVVLEVAGSPTARGGEPGLARFQGIAFEPIGSADSTIAWLDSQSIGHSAAFPFKVRSSGKERVLWTTFGLEVPPEEANIFVCDYKDRRSVYEGRLAASQQLSQSNGGPLGIQALSEIRVALKDLKHGSDLWLRLFGRERQISENLLGFSEGPTIRLSHAELESISGIVLKVHALANSRTYLGTKGLLGLNNGSFVTILPSAVQGLMISITE